jgi:hypothetical protein
VRITTALLTVCCCLSFSAAASAQPHFNPKDIVNRVRSAHPILGGHGPSISNLDDGEFLIDTSDALVPAPGGQDLPALAFDGTNYLVVWQDSRDGVYYEIYGARVTPDGVILDPAGIAIPATHQRTPAVAFCGGDYLVVWEDSYHNTIRGARVTTAGVVLDSASILITSSIAFNPVATSDSDNFLVVWGDARNVLDNNIYGARVTPGGTVLDPGGIAISRASGSQQYPAVACGGSNFLVVWQDNRSGKDNDIYGARVSSTGALLDSTGIAIMVGEGYQQEPGVAFGGGNYLVAWQDDVSGVHGARVTPAGELLDRPGFAISPWGFGYYPKTTVAFDDTDFFVAWPDDRAGDAIYGARVTTSGIVLDTAGIPLSTGEGGRAHPAAVFDGANLFVVWTDGRGNWYDNIYGTRVTAAGVVLDSAGIIVSTGSYAQSAPSAAFDGENYLAVWEDGRTGGAPGICGARVMPSGVVLDSIAIPISSAESLQWQPAVASDRQDFLVVWAGWRGGDEPDVYGARVTPAGEVLDTAGFIISSTPEEQQEPAIAFDGQNYLVVWQDQRGGGGNDDIYGARVTPTGVVLDSSGIAISLHAASGEYQPAVAFDGRDFFVTWRAVDNAGYGDIYGARVTPEGSVLDSEGIAISTAAADEASPALAFDGEDILAVWQTRYNSHGICGARISPDGVVLDSAYIVISTGTDDDLYPVLVFDGGSYLVVWQDSRGGTNVDLYGARVSPDGEVFDEGLVVSQGGNQVYPVLVRGPGSQMFLAYQGWAGTLGGKTYDADRVWGMMDPNPGIAEMTRTEVLLTSRDATIVRGVLFLPEASSHRSQVASLLDMSGRKVLDLHPGANDVSRLSPGVYFVREREVRREQRGSAVRKVVITE